MTTTPIKNHSSLHDELIYMCGAWFALVCKDISLPQMNKKLLVVRSDMLGRRHNFMDTFETSKKAC